MKEFIFNQFICKFQYPSSDKALNDYIDYNIDYCLLDEAKYTEKHHILPRSAFPQYKDEIWNVVKLNYNHHVESHILLFKAYPNVFELYRTLNWMINRKEKCAVGYKEALSKHMSKISKDYWDYIKKYDIDQYNKMCLHTSERMKSWQAKHMANVYYEKHDGRRKQSKKFKALWKNKEYKERVISTMLVSFNTPDCKEKRSLHLKERWKNNYNEMCETNRKINSSTEVKIKHKNNMLKLWREDPEYRKKMLKRKPRGSNGEKIKEKWKNEEFKQKQKISRLAYKIKTCMMLTHQEKEECKTLSNEKIVDKYSNKYKTKQQMIFELKNNGFNVKKKLTTEEIYEIYKKANKGG